MLATANRLLERLADPAFAERTRSLGGIVGFRQEGSPQAVTLELGDGSVRLRHGPPPEGAAPGAELESWLAELRSPPPGDWRQHARRFWAALEEVPGAPTALVAVERDSGETLRLGAAEGPAVEVQGSAQALAGLFAAEFTLLDGVFEQGLRMRGGFPDLSLFAAAAYRLRYGDPAAAPAARPEQG